MKSRKFLLLIIACATLASCSHPAVPKPYGYFRITLPEHAYQQTGLEATPYLFDYSTQARIETRQGQDGETWFDIAYPAFNARVHCSYIPVHNNLRSLSDDAQEFVYKHAAKATSIPERDYANPEARVYGVLYQLKGNTASPYQFYLTDSTRHFFRGALYFNCIPNEDSLSVVADYISEDLYHLIESFTWNP